MDGNILIENIRSLCKKRKISISKLESDLFLSPGLISRWNKSVPAMDKIMDIAKYFDVSIDELVGRTKKSSSYANIDCLLMMLYNRSLVAEVTWEILNFEDPPVGLENIVFSFFFKSEPCDCYFTSYMDGYFFLTITHSPRDDLQLALYTLPDIYSQPECVCSETEQLFQIYEYLNRLLAKQLNQIKTTNFINAFIADPAMSDNEKITPMRNVNEASNF